MGVEMIDPPGSPFWLGAVMKGVVEVRPAAPLAPAVVVLAPVPLLPPTSSGAPMWSPGDDAALHAATMTIAEATQTER
jgi:hypothetical protein